MVGNKSRCWAYTNPAPNQQNMYPIGQHTLHSLKYLLVPMGRTLLSALSCTICTILSALSGLNSLHTDGPWFEYWLGWLTVCWNNWNHIFVVPMYQVINRASIYLRDLPNWWTLCNQMARRCLSGIPNSPYSTICGHFFEFINPLIVQSFRSMRTFSTEGKTDTRSFVAETCIYTLHHT